MARIFKWTLRVEKREMLQVPQGTTFFAVDEQYEQLVIWGAVPDDKAPLEPRFIRVITTGEPFEADPLSYIGTASLKGWFVAHVFEEQPHAGGTVSDRAADDFREIAAAVAINEVKGG